MNLPARPALTRIALGARSRASANQRNGRSIAASPRKTE